MDKYIRLVVYGSKQVSGTDYTNSFAPVVKHTRLRIYLAIEAVHRNMERIRSRPSGRPIFWILAIAVSISRVLYNELTYEKVVIIVCYILQLVNISYLINVTVGIDCVE